MELIKKGNITAGDYIKADYWKVTYFQTTGLSEETYRDNDGAKGKMIFAKRWFDFDKKGNFIGIDEKRKCMIYNAFKYYKLTEEEFLKIVGKYLIADKL